MSRFPIPTRFGARYTGNLILIPVAVGVNITNTSGGIISLNYPVLPVQKTNSNIN
jgi:hypothetical protein